ncbi:MAG: hypothetical protein ABIQ51_06550 [Mesorhizobium sp.]
MTDKAVRIRPILAYAALAVLLAAGAAQSAAGFKDTRAVVQPDTQTAEQAFADAPDGVDPMVTGPVSTAFKQRQVSANCEDAVWPNIPMICYPD